MIVKNFHVTKDIIKEIDGDITGISIYLKGALSEYIKTDFEDKNGEVCVHFDCITNDVILIVDYFDELYSPDWTPTEEELKLIKEITEEYI